MLVYNKIYSCYCTLLLLEISLMYSYSNCNLASFKNQNQMIFTLLELNASVTINFIFCVKSACFSASISQIIDNSFYGKWPRFNGLAPMFCNTLVCQTVNVLFTVFNIFIDLFYLKNGLRSYCSPAVRFVFSFVLWGALQTSHLGSRSDRWRKTLAEQARWLLGYKTLSMFSI